MIKGQLGLGQGKVTPAITVGLKQPESQADSLEGSPKEKTESASNGRETKPGSKNNSEKKIGDSSDGEEDLYK